MKERPRLLYRYVDSETAWECLKEATLAFVPPIRFNDPFDTNPALDLNLRPEQINALSKHCPPERLDPTRIRQAMLENRIDFMERLIGAACFTEKDNDPLMWAHYGGRHRGVMIGFDAAHSEFSTIEQVTYSQDRPLVELEGGGVGKKLLIKSDVWEREEEWRMWAELSQCEVKMIRNIPVYVRRFNRNCFASITFGCYADESFVMAVTNSLKRWRLEHCEVRRVQLCDTSYKLIPERIDIV